ncbi:MAG TPA: hypothetical protein VJT73_07270, partial [Polyangiaceae bacterium]|nr:hypothetical protein [Polyangiaceae bacterium]
LAVLQSDGRLLGRDDAPLGKIGLRNASPPRGELAWLSVGDRGEVTRYDPDGGPYPDGAWTSCGPSIRTCTLAAHVITLVETRRQRGRPGYPGYGPGVGIGVGFGMVVAP